LTSGATPPSNERTLEIDWAHACEFHDGSGSKNRINAANAAGNTKTEKIRCLTRLAPVRR